MRISDWSSDVCSSDLIGRREVADQLRTQQKRADQRQGAVIVGVCILIAVAIIGFAAFKPIKEWWDLRAFNDIDMSGIGAPAADVCGKVETKKADGNQEHVESGVDVEYTDAPPAFGKHENTTNTPDRKHSTNDDRPPTEHLDPNPQPANTNPW